MIIQVKDKKNNVLYRVFLGFYFIRKSLAVFIKKLQPKDMSHLT